MAAEEGVRAPLRARPGLAFEIEATDGAARAGRLRTRAGFIQTPLFMPVGTQGSVKGLRPDWLHDEGARVLLVNAYHLFLRPGLEVVKAAGGVNRFMGWPGLTLADSGGFQVFSLTGLVKVADEGVSFQSHIDGRKFFITPENLMDIQRQIGADIIMPLDQCVPFPCDEGDASIALERTNRWAQRSLDRFRAEGQAIFGIVQGSTFETLRAEGARKIASMDFDGYAVGGVSVGEGPKLVRAVLDWTFPCLPAGRPRYVMGLGRPEDLLEAIGRGADMFDCVLPTRNGRNGQAFTLDGVVRIRNARYAADQSPLERNCSCYVCENFTKAYLRHLFMAREMLGPILLSMHNIAFFLRLMQGARQAILAKSYRSFCEGILGRIQAGAV